MTSLLVQDLSRSDVLGREEMLAVRGGIMIIERPPEEGPQPVDFCGTGSPIFPGLPSIPALPPLPALPELPRNCWERAPAGPAGPCGPAFDPGRLQ